MARTRNSRNGERGAALVEFTIGALVFLTATFGVLEFSRLLWTHNALSDATRRGARYAVTNAAASESEVKNVMVYGNPDGTGNEIIYGLDTTKVSVEYKVSSITGVYGYPDGEVTVSISGFQFQFVVPLLGTTLTMPDYLTTLTAESAGSIPTSMTPSPTPGPSPSPTPAPSPTPNPTPDPTPTPTPTPTPSPTPAPCAKGDSPADTGCVCGPPMSVNGVGKCM